MPNEFKTPYRGGQRVTEVFNDGLVYIYSVSDGAEPGYFPQENLTEKFKLFYQERRVGMNRAYLARQNMSNIQRVIRVPRPAEQIITQDIARTEDGEFYQIDLIQTVPDVYPACLDLTLVKIEQFAER